MIFRFGSFTLDVERDELTRDGVGSELTPKVFALLRYVLENAGRTVTKDELLDAVWPETVVGEASLTQAISQLRRALGEEAEGGALRTVRGRGYRLDIPVESLEAPGPGQVVETPGPVEVVESKAGATPSPEPPEEPAATPRSRLRWVGAALGAGLVIGLFQLGAAPERKPSLSLPPPAVLADRASVAVLPFADMSPGGDQEHFSDGISEEITNSLARVRRLRVVARTSAFAFKGTGEDVRSIGGKLSVGTIVEGSVRRSGDSLRITAQLIDARDGYHVWSGSYDRPLEDVFEVQEEIAAVIVEALLRELPPEPTLPAPPPPRPADVRAYEALLSARAAAHVRTPESLREAIGHLERALAIDPGYAQAIGLLSQTTLSLSYFEDTAQMLRRSEAAARKALQLDPSNEDARLAMAHERKRRWDLAGAEVIYRSVLEDSPGNAHAYESYATHLAARGRLDEAMPLIRTGLALDPLSPLMNRQVGRMLLYQGDLDESIAQLWRSLEINPDGLFAPALLWAAYEEKGMQTEAREALLHLAPAWTRPLLRIAGRLFGTRATLRALLELEIRRTGEPCPHNPESVAQLWAYIGDGERTIECFEWVADHDLPSGYVRLHPFFDPYRDDPGFVRVLERLR